MQVPWDRERFVRKGVANEATFQLDSSGLGMGRSQLRGEQGNIPDGGKKACQGPEPSIDVLEGNKTPVWLRTGKGGGKRHWAGTSPGGSQPSGYVRS